MNNSRAADEGHGSQAWKKAGYLIQGLIQTLQNGQGATSERLLLFPVPVALTGSQFLGM